ncbi:YiiX/YebB-like N1pC/P60 family cysteine hydrolase [Loigolactobacillus binensis]|uniref:YiiX/YebB-like N1pC/P60 family cysteine hydrolase n=2 Tax=Loigolactobacillus binensis TaxID=2559922 RepID=A0ABW3ECV7_9LACO
MPTELFKNADLLFITSRADAFANAIVMSTTTAGQHLHYDHVALVEVTAKHQVFVLHALPKSGSIREPYAAFQKRHYALVDLYRVQHPLQAELIIAQAKSQLGQVYNHSYAPTAAGYYCADFIFAAFASDQIFTLRPMSFKAPTQQTLLPFWRAYYAQLGCAVPEGELGLNPNAMARQNCLRKVTTLVAP